MEEVAVWMEEELLLEEVLKLIKLWNFAVQGASISPQEQRGRFPSLGVALAGQQLVP
jgi:hypothetical protein